MGELWREGGYDDRCMHSAPVLSLFRVILICFRREMNKKILEESSVRVAPALSNKEDIELNQAIMASLQTHPQADLYEPLNPEQRIRKEGQAVGLRNVGNSTFINCSCFGPGMSLPSLSLLFQLSSSIIFPQPQVR